MSAYPDLLARMTQSVFSSATEMISKSYFLADPVIESLFRIDRVILEALEGLGGLDIGGLFARHVTQLSVSLLLGSVCAVGDLFLVSKAEHQSSAAAAKAPVALTCPDCEGNESSDGEEDMAEDGRGDKPSGEASFCERRLFLEKMAAAVRNTAEALAGPHGRTAPLALHSLAIAILQFLTDSSETAPIDEAKGILRREVADQIQMNALRISSVCPGSGSQAVPDVLWAVSTVRGRHDCAVFLSLLMSGQPDPGLFGLCPSVQMKDVADILLSVCRAGSIPARVGPPAKKMRFVIRKDESDGGTGGLGRGRGEGRGGGQAAKICVLLLLLTRLSLAGGEGAGEIPDLSEALSAVGRPTLRPAVVPAYLQLWIYSSTGQVTSLLGLLGAGEVEGPGLGDEVRSALSHEAAFAAARIIARDRDRDRDRGKDSLLALLASSLSRFTLSSVIPY